MLLKSMARKTVSFGQLLDYCRAPQQTGTPLLHNLHSDADDLAALRAEFHRNAHLLPPRRNGNILYHEILSFSAADATELSVAALEDLIRRYLEQRAPYALAYAQAHFDTACPHVHVLISANNVGSHRRLRLSKRAFRKVQRELERYQREHYPQLQHSLAQTPRSETRLSESRAEQERRRRGARQPSRKEEVRALLAGELAVTASGEDCYRRLLAHGFRLYRRGRTVGVEDLDHGRRYRLKTLGLAGAFEQARTDWQRLRAAPSRSDRSRRQRDRHRAPELDR